MQEFDIVLITEDRFAEPPVVTEYIGNLLTDDRILAQALEAHGLRVIRKSWSDPHFDWSTGRFAIFRTTWDYFNRFDEFQNWLDITSKKTTFINPIEIVRWNMDKHYLADLEKNNIHIVETCFIEKEDPRSLDEIYLESGFDHCILKPAVSGAARHTYQLFPQNILQHEHVFRQLIQNEAMLLQPFQKNIISEGEVAMMVIGGKFTHAVLKKPKQGDFRVQDDFGGTLHVYEPSPDEIRFAENAVASCTPQPVYARVDMVNDNSGKPAIMELELIEPEMWFRRNPPAAALLTAEILKLF